MNKKGKSGLNTIYLIVGIIVGIIAIITFFLVWVLPNLGKVVSNSNDPFQILVSPTSINEGQYDKIPFTITIIPDSNLNITSFELQRKNLIVERLNKNSQTSVSQGFCLTTKYYSSLECGYESLFNCPPSSWDNDCNKRYEASVALAGCPNCFYGSSFPYQITFNIIYSEGGMKKTFTKQIQIPIID
ncbi:MAG: hypothetical protein AABX99_01890 [Nanoarchaeota archaeon]